jgi:mannose-6-phosphate isomerase-like protein (cupin superfamily)
MRRAPSPEIFGRNEMDDLKSVWPRQPVAAVDEPLAFSMRNLPLLKQGTSYEPLATAENLWLAVKVYASGGENALHAHDGEDHAFIVLQGRATFTYEGGRKQVVDVHEGVMIPRSVKYMFEADEAENLVLLRVGGGARAVKGLEHLTHFGTPKDVVNQTKFADGSIKVGTSPKNGETAKVKVLDEGKCFSPK